MLLLDGGSIRVRTLRPLALFGNGGDWPIIIAEEKLALLTLRLLELRALGISDLRLVSLSIIVIREQRLILSVGFQENLYVIQFINLLFFDLFRRYLLNIKILEIENQSEIGFVDMLSYLVKNNIQIRPSPRG